MVRAPSPLIALTLATTTGRSARSLLHAPIDQRHRAESIARENRPLRPRGAPEHAKTPSSRALSDNLQAALLATRSEETKAATVEFATILPACKVPAHARIASQTGGVPSRALARRHDSSDGGGQKSSFPPLFSPRLSRGDIPLNACMQLGYFDSRLFTEPSCVGS